MRVIVAHNFYRSDSPSGENAVVEFEVDALRERGVEVIELFRDSDDIVAGRVSKAQLAFSPTRNNHAVSELRRLIRSSRPDVLHAHNLFPLLSPALVSQARRHGVATVATVHNHRYYCMAATLRRDGHDCTECLRLRTPLPGLVHGCYRGSRLQSASMAMALTRHAPTFKRIDRCIALSADIRDTLVRFGVSPERIVIKPNTVDDPGPPTPPGRDVLYVGRLIEEKGIGLLLEAWQRAPDGGRGRLVIAGDGPLRPQVEEAARRRDDLVYLGKVEPGRVHELMTDAAVVVVPSLWSEAFPRVVVEALAHGRGVLTTPFGSLPEIVGDGGWIVPADAPAWDRTLTRIAGAPEESVAKGRAGRATFERKYSRDVVMDQLLQIYRKVLQRAS
jgi:glycosyltransferase involved in cell wall biosynthesis